MHKLPYSSYRTCGEFIFISGQLPVDLESGDICGDIKTQTRNSLLNIKKILSSLNLDIGSVVKTTVFLQDMKNFDAMNEVYADFFANPYPARSAFAVKELPKNALVEIEAIAYKG